MRILFRNDWCVFAATTIDEGDFLRPYRIPSETDFDFGIRQREYADRLRFVMRSIGLDPMSIHAPRLCHGATVAWVGDAKDTFPGETDGVATDEPDVALIVTGADCPPVFVFDPVSRAIGIVHSGREGTRQNIVGALVEELGEKLHTKSSDLVAVIGPAICGKHYQVTGDLSAPFGHVAHAVTHLADDDAAHAHLDLTAVIRAQLERAGVPRDCIRLDANECTFEYADRWFSRRRDTHEDRPGRARVQAFVAVRQA